MNRKQAMGLCIFMGLAVLMLTFIAFKGDESKNVYAIASSACTFLGSIYFCSGREK